MIIMFFAVIIGVLSLNLFSLNFTIQGLNRAVINTPIELLYTTIIPDNTHPVFVNRELELKLTSYYDKELRKYTDNYSVKFYFFNKDDYSYCGGIQCQAVEITVRSSLTFNYKYSRTMYYELMSNNG